MPPTLPGPKLAAAKGTRNKASPITPSCAFCDLRVCELATTIFDIKRASRRPVNLLTRECIIIRSEFTTESEQNERFVVTIDRVEQDRIGIPAERQRTLRPNRPNAAPADAAGSVAAHDPHRFCRGR